MIDFIWLKLATAPKWPETYFWIAKQRCGRTRLKIITDCVRSVWNAIQPILLQRLSNYAQGSATTSYALNRCHRRWHLYGRSPFVSSFLTSQLLRQSFQIFIRSVWWCVCVCVWFYSTENTQEKPDHRWFSERWQSAQAMCGHTNNEAREIWYSYVRLSELFLFVFISIFCSIFFLHRSLCFVRLPLGLKQLNIRKQTMVQWRLAIHRLHRPCCRPNGDCIRNWNTWPSEWYTRVKRKCIVQYKYKVRRKTKMKTTIDKR